MSPSSASETAAPVQHRRSRNKTLACWLALGGGLLGLQRFYLHGRSDWLGWMCWLPSCLGAYGVWRARTFGLDDPWSWALIPLIGAVFSVGALHSIVIGLTSEADWNRRFQPGQAPGDRAGSTTRWTVVALVLAMLVGTTALMSTVAFTAQRAFEYAAR